MPVLGTMIRMISKMKYFITFFIIFIVFASCSGEKKEAAKAPQAISISVDSTLVEEIYQNDDLGFSFHPPSGWKRVDDSTLNLIRSEVEEGLSEMAFADINMYAVFLNKLEKCLAGVFEVGINGNKKIEEYKDLFKAVEEPKGQRIAEYMKDRIHILQFVIPKNKSLNYKLVFESPKDKLIQVDYFVPKNIYKTKSKAIESSIASINVY